MKLNKKGFTLVELLAVIVVLAVIMVIAIPTVIDSMNSAKKSSFAMYGQKMLNAAMSKVQGDALDGKSAQPKYKFSELVASSGQYKGYVSYNSNTNTYLVHFYNTDYMAKGASYDDLESWKKANCSGATLPPVCTSNKFLNSTDEDWGTAKAAIDNELK